MININVYVTIVITWIFLLWPGPWTGQDTAGGNGPVTPGSQTDATTTAADMIPGEVHGTGSSTAPTSGEDDIADRRGMAGGEAVNMVDNEYNMHFDEEVEVASTGIDAGTDVGLYPAGQETVGVPEGVRAGFSLGERPPVTGRWSRVRTRLEGTPEHWTCDPTTCRRCSSALTRRTLRHQFELIQTRSLDVFHASE